MRISDWSSDVCSSDLSPVLSGEDIGWDFWLGPTPFMPLHEEYVPVAWRDFWALGCGALGDFGCHDLDPAVWAYNLHTPSSVQVLPAGYSDEHIAPYGEIGYYYRSEEHTSELQSLMRNSYAVF